MAKAGIGGFMPDIDILDIRVLERWERAAGEFAAYSGGTPENVKESEKAGYLISGVISFFDTVFGDGAGEKIMGGSGSLADALARFAEAGEYIEAEAAESVRRAETLAARFLPKSR